MVDAINRRRVLGILSVGLVVGPLAAGCTTLPPCANGPDDRPGECVPWPKSPPAIGARRRDGAQNDALMVEQLGGRRPHHNGDGAAGYAFSLTKITA